MKPSSSFCLRCRSVILSKTKVFSATIAYRDQMTHTLTATKKEAANPRKVLESMVISTLSVACESILSGELLKALA